MTFEQRSGKCEVMDGMRAAGRRSQPGSCRKDRHPGPEEPACLRAWM